MTAERRQRNRSAPVDNRKTVGASGASVGVERLATADNRETEIGGSVRVPYVTCDRLPKTKLLGLN